MRNFVLGALIAISLAGCGEPENRSYSATPAAASSASTPALVDDPNATGNDAFRFPGSFKPVYKIVHSGDSNIPAKWTPDGLDVLRRDCKIMVPNGLSRDTLVLNMKHAVKVVYDKYRPHAVVVGAYRQGTDKDGGYNAGQCTLAPGGDWSRADERRPFEELSVKSVVEEEYFNDLDKEMVHRYHADPKGKLFEEDMRKDRPEFDDLRKRFSELERKGMARELYKSSDSAVKQAEEQYPYLEAGNETAFPAQNKKRAELEESLDVKFHSRLAKRYKISMRQVDILIQEAAAKHWR